MKKREKTKEIKVKDTKIGRQNKVVIQSMTNTKTKNVEETVAQIIALENQGCQLVRVAVLDEEDANAIKQIKSQIHIPLVADIHFNYKLALIAIEAGVDKIRLNPGNIGSKENVEAVVKMCQAYNVPIRIGINSGSIEKHLLDENLTVTPEIMVESALSHIKILEDLNFYDIIVSLKASDVQLTIDAYRLAAKTFDYPLHLGVTEAGTLISSAIKSSAALGVLLEEGIGDTIRISITDDPIKEILVARKLLSAFNLGIDTPNLISCPTCGRLEYDMIDLAMQVETFLDEINSDISVAVMGCAVNGPQEARRADIGVAGGNNEGLIFKNGEVFKKVKASELFDELKVEILNMID